MTKTHLTFDTETTGLDTSKDQIIEISIQIGLGEDAEIKTWRIKPTKKISKEATAVHGIANQDLKDCPSFKEVGGDIVKLFDSAEVIIGYNVLFDLQILQAELSRNGFKQIALNEKKILDPLNIWRRMRPRKLTDAYKKFCGKDLEGAHSAEADVKATAEVYSAMHKRFELDKLSIEELSAMSMPSDWVGISHHIKWRNKTPVFSFGKGNGKPVWDFIQSDPSYARWMKNADFPPHVTEICDNAVEMEKDEFLSWIAKSYPQPDLED